MWIKFFKLRRYSPLFSKKKDPINREEGYHWERVTLANNDYYTKFLEKLSSQLNYLDELKFSSNTPTVRFDLCEPPSNSELSESKRQDIRNLLSYRLALAGVDLKSIKWERKHEWTLSVTLKKSQLADVKNYFENNDSKKQINLDLRQAFRKYLAHGGNFITACRIFGFFGYNDLSQVNSKLGERARSNRSLGASNYLFSNFKLTALLSDDYTRVEEDIFKRIQYVKSLPINLNTEEKITVDVMFNSTQLSNKKLVLTRSARANIKKDLLLQLQGHGVKDASITWNRVGCSWQLDINVPRAKLAEIANKFQLDLSFKHHLAR